MRFSAAVVLGALAALASAQTSTSTKAVVASTTSSAAADSSQSAAQAAIIKCLDACTAGDVSCTAKCISVPNPSAAQVNATNNCVAACPKGNGTATDNTNYASCVSNCISTNYYTSSGSLAGPTGSSGSSGSGSGSDSGSGSNTGGAGSPTSGGSSPTGAGSAGSTTSSKAAAEALRVGSSAVGLLGFMAAFLVI